MRAKELSTYLEPGRLANLLEEEHYVWTPSLKKANVRAREMEQTRHSFATNALSYLEHPLWIVKVMGHCDADMVINVYSKFIEDGGYHTDGDSLTKAYHTIKSNKEGV
jgi:hypothetical protein